MIYYIQKLLFDVELGCYDIGLSYPFNIIAQESFIAFEYPHITNNGIRFFYFKPSIYNSIFLPRKDAPIKMIANGYHREDFK